MTQEALASRQKPEGWLARTTKFFFAVILCLSPPGALLVLGWLTQKTQREIRARQGIESSASWPHFLRAASNRPTGRIRQLFVTVWHHFKRGVKAWAHGLLMLGPFALIWLGAWTAGWENSFNKSYELSGVWPLTSLVAIAIALPALVVWPLAVARYADTESYSEGLNIARLWSLFRSAPLVYLSVTVFCVLGAVGILGARAAPVFVEELARSTNYGGPDQTLLRRVSLD